MNPWLFQLRPRGDYRLQTASYASKNYGETLKTTNWCQILSLFKVTARCLKAIPDALCFSGLLWLKIELEEGCADTPQQGVLRGPAFGRIEVDVEFNFSAGVGGYGDAIAI